LRHPSSPAFGQAISNVTYSCSSPGVLVVVLAVWGLPTGQRWAWLALWVVPAFLLSHVALLGTVVPDAPFALLAAVALWLARPAPAAASVVPGERVAPEVTARG
jgi:hypothetical protein